MGYRKFSLLVVLRTVLIMGGLLVLAYLFYQPGYHASIAFLAVLLMVQVAELINFVAKTNQELIRFFDAARYADFSQRFELKEFGSGFEELGNIFEDILHRLQTSRSQQEIELKHLKAMVEHIPVPLLSIHHDQQITLLNSSARRLFGTNHIAQLSDLAQFSDSFPEQLSLLEAGKRQLLNIDIDGMEFTLNVMATHITHANKKEMLVSMQDILQELDGAQLQAWQELVSVLTHEIMNSITPVASLAKTSLDLVNDVQAKLQHQPQILEELDDVTHALHTVSRRSDGLMHFVSNYRRLTRLPEPNMQRISINQLFNNVKAVATHQWQEKLITLTTSVQPAELTLAVDVDLIEQILINLLQNAEQALEHRNNKQVSLSAYLNKRGHIVIEVNDNGLGVPQDIAANIFIPFFTTKKNGSGVGLALARQVMRAHHGHISLKSSAEHGATFSLTF